MAAGARTKPLELWGGIECTVNRVGDEYFDQVELSGHATRGDDLDLIAALGIRTLRYPILWERHAPVSPHPIDWSWADDRMSRMRDLGISPVVGLIHHGSGPRYTSLSDPGFPAGLARYARAVAERFPSIRCVTPVNEPLTTARFAGLYGHWHPHQASAESFAGMLVNQCLAIRSAFQATREMNPEVQLIQTEDLGRISGTPRTLYQADFENERRWLTFDLLCGRVDETHPLWPYLATTSETRRALEALVAEPCPPHLIGINYYVTSDRFLDDRLSEYPPEARGGNGRDEYVDVEAARVSSYGISGHEQIITEAWRRYRIPIALTEVHLGCTREHQIRWLAEAWQGALNARQLGCDVRAVTAWALFGSSGWDTLVTRPPFNYESGAFDIRARVPRPTALAAEIKRIVESGTPCHPVARDAGWWRSGSRFAAPPYPPRDDVRTRLPSTPSRTRGRPILITGGQGTLGSAFDRICRLRGLEARAVPRGALDVSNRESVRQALASLRPWALVNAAGYVRVEDAERECASCFRANVIGVSVLAAECARAGIPFVTFSSDLVFDGTKNDPYVESDEVAPLNIYGASKATGERRALEACESALVIRTSAFFGPWDSYNFISRALTALRRGADFPAASDAVVSPTYVPDLVNASLDLLLDGERGIWHIANEGERSWSQLATDVAVRAGYPPHRVLPVRAAALGRARQPRYSVLASERQTLLPPLENALDRWFAEAHLPENTAVTA